MGAAVPGRKPGVDGWIRDQIGGQRQQQQDESGGDQRIGSHAPRPAEKQGEIGQEQTRGHRHERRDVSGQAHAQDASGRKKAPRGAALDRVDEHDEPGQHARHWQEVVAGEAAVKEMSGGQREDR